MSTVPVQLDPETTRRNLAIQFNNQPPSVNPLEPQMAAPGPIAMPGQPQAPDLSVFPAKAAPPVSGPFGQKAGTWAPQGTTTGEKQERERLIGTGSGISQIPQRIESAMPNHPVPGKVVGHGLQGLAGLADTVLSNLPGSLGGIGRGIESMIPGTQGHHAALLGQADTALTQDEANAGKEAETVNLESMPELHQAQSDLAQEKQDEVENNHTAQIDQHLRTTGFKRDETGNIVPDEQSPAYQKQQIANQLAHATMELRNAQTAFEQMKGDPNSVPNRQIAQRLQIAKQTQDRMTGMMGAMQERADAMMMNARAGTMGVDMDNKPLPGAMLTEDGQTVGSRFQANVRPTGQQRGKGNMAESADQQLNDLKDIVTKRPDVFGPASGRVTDFNVWFGSQDPDAQRFRAARTIAGDHLAGTFGGRSETALRELDSAIGHFKDNPAAVTAGLDQLKEANRVFLQAGKVHTVGGHGNQPAQGGASKGVFNSAAWAAANKGQDVEAAKAEAKRQGYEVK